LGRDRKFFNCSLCIVTYSLLKSILNLNSLSSILTSTSYYKFQETKGNEIEDKTSTENKTKERETDSADPFCRACTRQGKLNVPFTQEHFTEVHSKGRKAKETINNLQQQKQKQSTSKDVTNNDVEYINALKEIEDDFTHKWTK
jgi:hypothetical protein